MFTYYYRILDKYKKPITALAILTDNNKQFHPTFYKYEFLDTSVLYKFKTYKVLEADIKALAESNNPFASVIEVVQTALKKGKIADSSLFDLKITLVRKMLGKNFSKPQINALLRFLKLYIRFENKELITKFDTELDTITKRPNTMGLKEFVLDRERRMARKEGLQEGREEGREKGREKGREEGMEMKERQKNSDFTKSLLLQTDFSDEKIANLAGVEVEFVKEMREKSKQ